MILGNNKHDNEVLFLEAAAGLNLTILCAQDVLQEQENSQFSGLPTPRPSAPIEAESPKATKLYPPTRLSKKWFLKWLGKKNRVKGIYVVLDPNHPWFMQEYYSEPPIFFNGTCYLRTSEQGKFCSIENLHHGVTTEEIENASFGANEILRCYIDYSSLIHSEISRNVVVHNQYIEETYNNEKQIFQKQNEQYQKQQEQYTQQLADYREELKTYNKQLANSENAFQDVRAENIQILNTILCDASEKLESLYSVTKMLPGPYQYPEAVFYLYDFLSSSSDEYDIKYALERVDANEIKRLMTELIQNQQRQMLLFGTILASIDAKLESIVGTDEEALSDSEQSLQDSQQFLLKNADIAEQLKPFPAL
jgi:hypothetical protein